MNKSDLLKAIVEKDESAILMCMKPLIYKTIKGVPGNMQQDCYQELSIEVIRTVRRQYQKGMDDFTRFLKENKLINYSGRINSIKNIFNRNL